MGTEVNLNHSTSNLCNLRWFLRLPEQSFEVFGELRPAGVAWIHCDEDANRRAKIHFLSHKVKSLLFISDGVLYAFDLHKPSTKTTKHSFSLRVPNLVSSAVPLSPLNRGSGKLHKGRFYSLSQTALSSNPKDRN